MRSLPRLLLTVVLSTVTPALVTTMATPAALADEPLQVGTALEATSDVKVHKAELVRGSRVRVTKLLLRDGRVQGVSVALADGHVAKLTLTQVHSSFRIVGD